MQPGKFLWPRLWNVFFLPCFRGASKHSCEFLDTFYLLLARYFVSWMFKLCSQEQAGSSNWYFVLKREKCAEICLKSNISSIFLKQGVCWMLIFPLPTEHDHVQRIQYINLIEGWYSTNNTTFFQVRWFQSLVPDGSKAWHANLCHVPQPGKFCNSVF